MSAVALLVLLAAAGATAALTAVLRRRLTLLPLAVAAVLPFRVPVTVGGEHANLLLPLYAVIAAGVASRVLAGGGLRGRKRSSVELLLLGVVALYALQTLYADDPGQALRNLGFFYLPFGVLYVLLADLDWTPRLLTRSLVVLTAVAVLLCLVAFGQELTQTVWWNDKLRDSNTYNPYFRANSLFFDPNIFGRHLAVTMVLVAAVAAWSTDRRGARLAAGLLVVLWLGLLTTLSQSSFGALVVGVVVLAVAYAGASRVLVAAAAAVAIGAVLVVAFPTAFGLQLDDAGAVRKATSGRSELVQGGVDLFERRPVLGFGSGTFAEEYRTLRRHRDADVAASHTIPLTVAVEQGVVGLAAYLALLAVAFRTLLRGASNALPRAAIAGAFAAVVFHTLTYAAFLEDPWTWVLLAVGVALTSASLPAFAEPVRVAVPRQRSSSATSVSPTSKNSL